MFLNVQIIFVVQLYKTSMLYKTVKSKLGRNQMHESWETFVIVSIYSYVILLVVNLLRYIPGEKRGKMRIVTRLSVLEVGLFPQIKMYFIQ